jgi:hypothetical protein
MVIVQARVRHDIRFEANISEYLFALKRIKQVLFASSHGSKSVDFTCEMNKNGREYSFLGEYFQKEPNIN